MKTYGIDLGTTYSAIAVLDENNLPQIIENFNEGKYTLPSAVYFPEGGDPVVGTEAKNFAEVEPDRVVQFVKRGIGTADAKKYEFDGVTYCPTKISSIILKRIVEYAQAQNHEVKDVVITCPANFKIERRNATRQAAELIGLNVLNILNEPTAAALNYCSREYKENRKILVYDLGGGTFDVTLLDFTVDDSGNPSIDVIDTDGDDRLGGVDWDDCLYEHILERYAEETGESTDDKDAEFCQQVRNIAEDTKWKLTTLPAKKVTIERTVNFEVTRETFEELTKPLVARTLDFIRKLLDDTNHTSDDVHLVLLVGGSTKMPMIQAAVETMFPGKVQIEQPDFAVAKGAAIAASIEFLELKEKLVEDLEKELHDIQLSGDTENFAEIYKQLEEVAPEIVQEIGADGAGLTLETVETAINTLSSSIQKNSTIGLPKDKLNSSFGPMILAENDTLVIDNLLFVGDTSPAESVKEYGTMADNQEAVRLSIYENIANDRVNCHVMPDVDIYGNPQQTDSSLKVNKIGELYIPLPSGTPAGSPIEVTFRYSTAGLDVIAKNPVTSEMYDTFIASAQLLSPEDFEATKAQFATLKTSSEI